jgi:CheY-like chemotaxis protein
LLNTSPKPAGPGGYDRGSPDSGSEERREDVSRSIELYESGRKTILLAHDVKKTALLMRWLLELNGYRVFTAEDGREAVRKTFEITPSLIILDVSMPVMSGLEAWRTLKGNEETRDIPVILISAPDESLMRDEALSLGVGRCYMVPADVEELLQSISDTVVSVTVESESEREDAAYKRAKELKSKDPFRRCGEVLNGKYELTEFAGSGGMGAVYRGLSLLDQSVVAIKILQPHIVARNSEYAGLFVREAKHVRSLAHPHIVKIFDSGKDADLLYMVMEWVEGSSLEDVVTQGRLSTDHVTIIFEQICSAVSSAHHQGIIHLDLKPANVLLIEDVKPKVFVKVIDFGLSRIITKESGTTVTKFRGTHQYCAPEQFGGKVSPRSDIYSLGATLYHLLTGVIPFGTSYINAKSHPNLELPEIPSLARQCGLPSELDRVISKALSKNPALRQQSVKQLFEEFYAVMSSRSVSLPGELKGDQAVKYD